MRHRPRASSASQPVQSGTFGHFASAARTWSSITRSFIRLDRASTPLLAGRKHSDRHRADDDTHPGSAQDVSE
jgi:hypothetical protein